MKLKFVNKNRLLQIINISQIELEIIEKLALVKWVQWMGRGKRVIMHKNWLHNATFLPGGFWYKIMKLTQSNNRVEIENLDNIINKVTYEEISDYINDLEYKAEWLIPRWYQIKALYLASKYSISRGDFATGAGKTFICYAVSRWYLENKLQAKSQKILMVVPSVMLVKQTADDWMENYQSDDYIKLSLVCEGQNDMNPNANVIIGNIDTLANQPKDFYSNIGGVIFDEAHKLSTDQYKLIFNYIVGNDLSLIYGVSGSFFDPKHQNEFEAEAISGPILISVPAHQLMEEGSLTPVEVSEIELEYDYDYCELFFSDPKLTSNNATHYELNFIRESVARLELVSSFISKTEMNQLCLFKSTVYLRRFEKHLNSLELDKQIYVIIGEVTNPIREEIKKLTEINMNVIILATYGCMATGVSINNLSTLHLIEPPKSFIWLRQSIGRMVRLHESKKVARIISYVDIFKKHNKHWDGPRRNMTWTHLNHRIKIYKEQKFPYKVLGPLKITRKNG